MNGGDNRVDAGAGDDIVFAGNGDDRFIGGRGADGYALFLDSRDGNAAGWGHDVITDFRIGQDDQLIAFNAVEGFWDDPAQLLALAQSDFVTGKRAYGADISDQKPVAILLDVIQDGGDYGVQGENYLAQASNLLSDHFML